MSYYDMLQDPREEFPVLAFIKYRLEWDVDWNDLLIQSRYDSRLAESFSAHFILRIYLIHATLSLSNVIAAVYNSFGDNT